MIGASSSVLVRDATLDDAGALATVFRDCWRNAYNGIIPAAELNHAIHTRNETWWRRAVQREQGLLVLELAGTLAGYGNFGKARASRVLQGEIYELYLAPAYQGIGLGEHLFEACRQRLDARNLNGLIVWALTDNDRAVDFYWRRGGRPVAQATETFGRKTLSKVAFGWK